MHALHSYERYNFSMNVVYVIPMGVVVEETDSAFATLNGKQRMESSVCILCILQTRYFLQTR